MKKILSFILALTLLMSVSVLVVNAEESTDCIFIPAPDGEPGSVTYGFENPEYWKEVYVYATGGRSEEFGDTMTYPGVKLEEKYVDGYGYIHTFTFATGYYGTLLFNDGTKNDYKAELKEDFYDYCVEKLGEPLYEADVNIFKTYRYYDGTVLFDACSWEEPLEMGFNVMAGGYCIHRTSTFSPFGLGVYVSTNDEIYTLEEALNEKIISGIPVNHGFSCFEFHRVYKEGIDLNLMHDCIEAFGKRYDYKPYEGESVYCEPYGYVDDCAVFYAYFDHCDYPAMNTQVQIGNYYFYNGFPCGMGEKNSVALYVLTPENKVYTLYEAYTQGIVTDLGAVAKLAGGVSIYGDYGERICQLLGIDINAEDCEFIYRQIQAYYEGYDGYGKPSEEATPDFITVNAGESVKAETPCVKRIGKYAVANEKTYAPYDLGYFVYFTKEDKLYNFEEAYNAHPELFEEMLVRIDYPSLGHYTLVGNVDSDRKITIKDATRIQKRIAGYELNERTIPELELEASDFNGDGKINIRDATAIQKMLAHVE